MGNFIGQYKNAISDEVVDYMMDNFHKMREFHSHGQIGGGNVEKEVKDSYDYNILDYHSLDPHLNSHIFPLLGEQLDACIVKYLKEYPLFVEWGMEENIKTGTSKQILEQFGTRYAFWPFSILMKRYLKGVGGYHAYHEDQGEDAPHTLRALVIMFYLNTVKEGGETEFYHQNLKVSPEKGKVVIFPTYFTHLHRGNIPISEDKYICNFWVLKGDSGQEKNVANKWIKRSIYER